MTIANFFTYPKLGSNPRPVSELQCILGFFQHYLAILRNSFKKLNIYIYIYIYRVTPKHKTFSFFQNMK